MRLLLKNQIPSDLNCDWQVYSQILFHLIQNAVKFSSDGGEIKINVAYCPLTFTRDKNLL